MVHEPDHPGRARPVVSPEANPHTVAVDRVLLIPTGRPAPEQSFYLVLQRGRGFRGHADGSGDGQQHGHAVRHRLVKVGSQAFQEPGCNLVEPQPGLEGVTPAGAEPFEDRDFDGGSLLLPHAFLPYSHSSYREHE
jgi:hypothetical protein